MNIYTSGYPRSGNTWLGWLLSDCLDGYWSSGGSLYRVGKKIDSDNIVVKTHDFDAPKPVVFIHRDPRDVVVSVMHYRQKTDLQETIHSIVKGTDSNPDMGKYENFVRSWLRTGKATVETTYESLSFHAESELVRICDEIGYPVTREKARDVADRQTIKRAQKLMNDTHAYRRGVAGAWVEYFTRQDAELFQELLGDVLIFTGYEKNGEWVKGVK